MILEDLNYITKYYNLPNFVLHPTADFGRHYYYLNNYADIFYWDSPSSVSKKIINLGYYGKTLGWCSFNAKVVDKEKRIQNNGLEILLYHIIKLGPCGG